MNATTHSEVDILTPKCHPVDKPQSIVRVEKKKKIGQGNGIVGKKFGNKAGKSLGRATLLVISNEGDIRSFSVMRRNEALLKAQCFQRLRQALGQYPMTRQRYPASVFDRRKNAEAELV